MYEDDACAQEKINDKNPRGGGTDSVFQLGKKQSLTIIKEVDFGVYLGEDADAPIEKRVLLPKKQVPGGAAIGDKVDVFLYKDSKDRIIATTNEPLLTLGEIRRLRVSQVTQIGAFLDWGLEKELLLPYREQTFPVKEGDEVLVALYIDKSSRLAATMKVYPYLATDSGYEKDDMVNGTVYEIIDNFGAFVAVDDKYSALIPKKELYGDVRAGNMIAARVVEVKGDGKLDLSVREKAYLQIEKDVEKILKLMEDQGGRLRFTDKSSPEVIKDATGMSKNEFKRAIGKLLKKGMISIESDHILLKSR